MKQNVYSALITISIAIFNRTSAMIEVTNPEAHSWQENPQVVLDSIPARDPKLFEDFKAMMRQLDDRKCELEAVYTDMTTSSANRMLALDIFERLLKFQLETMKAYIELSRTERL